MLAACSAGGNSSLTPATPMQSELTQPETQMRMLDAFHGISDEGQTVLVMPTREALLQSGTRQAMAVSNLNYGGGPIVTSPKIYLVYWGTSWNTTTGDPKAAKGLLASFLGHIGGSVWNGVTTQYTQSGGAHVGNPGGNFGGSYVDTSSKPASRPTDASISAEASKAATHFGVSGSNASIVVALPHGVVPNGFKTQYCAWHSWNGKVAYTNLPYLPDAGTGCGQGSVNSPGTLDGYSIVEGHEQAETETDPEPSSGWTDSSGAENGDKCAWTSLSNQSLNGVSFPMQPTWSNAISGCAMHL